MDFSKYVRGEWEIETLSKGIDRSTRRHSLLFTSAMKPFDSQWLSPIRKVNTDDFLDAPPGHLVCESVRVSIVSMNTGAKEVGEILAETETLYWLLRYEFIEQTPQKWNEILFPTATEGKYSKTQMNLAPTANMGEFFGAREFPVSAHE